VSFAIQPFGATRRGRENARTASIGSAPDGRVAITVLPSARSDRVTVSLTATGVPQPGLAEVKLVLIQAGVQAISLISTSGATRVTVPVDAEAATVAILSECAARWEHQPAGRPRWRFGLSTHHR
jgi:hypothetical protein